MNIKYLYNQQRMYKDLAWLFPIITPPEDYVDEAGQFIRHIHQHARIPVHTLLDMGCGAGHNDHTLQDHFQVTGVDISQEMLELARGLNPQVTYLLGDMCTLHLERTFDAVMVADSITYMLSEEDLRAVFYTAFKHLNPGGVFCTYAEEIPERFVQNGTFSSIHRRGDIEVAMIENYYDPDPADTTFEMTFVFLIRRSGELQIEMDHHLGGLFPLSTWRSLLEDVGFEVREEVFEGEDIPMFVGIKPLPSD